MDFFNQNGVQVLPWPACSPDLNPIEHLWDQLGKRVYSRHHPVINCQQLAMTLQEEWDNITQDLIQHFFSFFFWGGGGYGPFKNISLISSRSLIRGGGKPEYPEKNHLTYRCRTWHLTYDPSEARTHSGESDTAFNSKHEASMPSNT